MINGQTKIRKMVIIALFIAMSVVGGYIKIPNPITSSIALDSLPAYLATLLIGGVPGAIIGFLGHMVSAAIGGFALSLPIHFLVASQMAVIMLVFNLLNRKLNLWIAIGAGIILNGVAAPAMFIIIPGFGIPFFMGALLPLTAASALNAIAAGLVYYAIGNTNVVKQWRSI